MGWSQIANLDLKPEVVEDILNSIRATWTRTVWGWSAECDIAVEGNKIKFSGGWSTYNCKIPKQFRLEAKRRGLYDKR